MSWREHYQFLALEAYREVLRVLALFPFTWDTERALSEVRKILNVPNEAHANLISGILDEQEVRDFQKAYKEERLDEPCPYARRKRKRTEDINFLETRDSLNLGRGAKLTTGGSQAFVHPAAPEAKRGPGRPRVLAPGGAPGQPPGARLKIGGNKKDPFLSRQNSIVSDVANGHVAGQAPWTDPLRRKTSLVGGDVYVYGEEAEGAGGRLGGGGRGRGRGRVGARIAGRPSSGGRSPQFAYQGDLFIPSFMPCNDWVLEDIKVAQKDGKLTEDTRQHLLQLLEKRQQEIQDELELLMNLEALDSGDLAPDDAARFQNLLQDHFAMAEAAYMAEARDLDREDEHFGFDRGHG